MADDQRPPLSAQEQIDALVQRVASALALTTGEKSVVLEWRDADLLLQSSKLLWDAVRTGSVLYEKVKP